MRAFKFTPLLKSMIWGGNRIASYKGIAVDRSDIGESWELSGVKGDESVVAEGEYAGMTLPELIGQLKGELVGHAGCMFSLFTRCVNRGIKIYSGPGFHRQILYRITIIFTNF